MNTKAMIVISSLVLTGAVSQGCSKTNQQPAAAGASTPDPSARTPSPYERAKAHTRRVGGSFDDVKLALKQEDMQELGADSFHPFRLKDGSKLLVFFFWYTDTTATAAAAPKVRSWAERTGVMDHARSKHHREFVVVVGFSDGSSPSDDELARRDRFIEAF